MSASVESRVRALEAALDEREALIRHLKNELDMFRQVVPPLTQQVVTQLCVRCGLQEEGTTAPPQPRIKRQAISAEPVTTSQQTAPVKVPKTTK